MISLLINFCLSAAFAASPAHGWPELKVPAEAAELFNAVEGRTLEGRDAASVFLALVRPGHYFVHAAHRVFEVALDTEVLDRHEVALRIQMSFESMQLGRTFAVYTGAKRDFGPSLRVELKATLYNDVPALRLSLTPADGDESLVHVKFARNLTRLHSIAFRGPTLEHFRQLAPDHLTDARVDFKFSEMRPNFGLVLDCRTLLRRLTAKSSD